MATSITRVKTATAVLELPQPLRLGDMVVTRREYAAVEVELSNGVTGKAYCLTREAPMTQIVNRMFAPQLVGKTLGDLPQLWHSLFRASAIVGRVGLVRRALGLVDIALWDAASQAENLQLGVFIDERFPGVLPKRESSAPWIHRHALLVAAYPTDNRSARAVADEVIEHSEEGWRLFKVARSPDQKLMAELLKTLQNELPTGSQVVVDVGFGWRDSNQAVTEVAEWGDYSLAWLEDPLLPEDVEGISSLRKRTRLSIGVGDEVTDPHVFERLVAAEALDVVRLDVVALGGITPSLDLLAFASKNNLPVSGHIYPEVTVHLGVGVETFPRYAGPYDPSPSFIIDGPVFDQGVAFPSAGTGLGFSLDPQVFVFREDTA